MNDAERLKAIDDRLRAIASDPANHVDEAFRAEIDDMRRALVSSPLRSETNWTGYPDMLDRDAIPLAARIVAALLAVVSELRANGASLDEKLVSLAAPSAMITARRAITKMLRG